MRNVLVSVPVLLMLGAIVGVCEAQDDNAKASRKSGTITMVFILTLLLRDIAAYCSGSNSAPVLKY